MDKYKSVTRHLHRYINMDQKKEFQELNIRAPEITRISTLPLPKCDKCDKQAVFMQLNEAFCWYHAYCREKEK